MKFATRYDGKHDERSDNAKTIFTLPSRTQENFKDECDINLILKKYQATGVLPSNSKAALAHYGDFSKVPSYQDALNRVMEASDMFSQLPATLRFKFENDPGLLLNFLSDPKNREQAVELGLVDAPQPQKPSLAPKEPELATSTKSKGKTSTQAPTSVEED